MTKFIELTRLDGTEKILVNVYSIDVISVYNGITYINTIAGDGSYCKVQETYEEVKEKLKYIGVYLLKGD